MNGFNSIANLHFFCQFRKHTVQKLLYNYNGNAGLSFVKGLAGSRVYKVDNLPQPWAQKSETELSSFKNSDEP
jgi:hypothetical protein